MIAVLHNHVFCIGDGLLLPLLITNVLPARYFRKYQQAKPVTGIHEILTLRIMRSTHGIAAKLFFQNSGIFLLQGSCTGIAKIRPALMTVQSAQEDFFAIEIEAVRIKMYGAETN